MSGVIAVELIVAVMLFGAVWFLTSRRTKSEAGMGKSVVLMRWEDGII